MAGKKGTKYIMNGIEENKNVKVEKAQVILLSVMISVRAG